MDAGGAQRRDDRRGHLAGFFSPWAARTVLRWTSLSTLLDSLAGFFFHVRGIARKPGGWRLPVTNIVMGPPIFAPLLFGVSAYLGLIASFLRAGGSAGVRLSDGLGCAIGSLPLSKHEVDPVALELRDGPLSRSISRWPRSRRVLQRLRGARIRTTKTTSSTRRSGRRSSSPRA